MSLEITIYTKTATKRKLINELILEGFTRSKGIFESLETEEHIGFMWFGAEEYESFSGVEATVRLSTQAEKDKYQCSEWILHTRTRSSGSRQDKEKQNSLIRRVRKLFGGTFHNDWYGTNKYTNLGDYPDLSAPERGLILMKEIIQQKMRSLKYSLQQWPNSLIQPSPDEIEDKLYREFMKSIDPSIVVYNAMFPFLVAMLEYMLKETFLILIRYDKDAQRIIEEENIKVPLKDVLKIRSKEMLVEDVIAENFTFQNLGQVNRAYKMYLKIDIGKIFAQKKRIGQKMYRLYPKLEEIIAIRHDIIHHFGHYTHLDKSTFISYLDTVGVALRVLLSYLDSKNKWSISKS
jgi:hypothetical protein